MTFDSNTSVYAVFGDPVSHSLSPVMHNRAFEFTGYKGVYLAFGVKNIKNALISVRTLGIKGASITIPHKIEVMKYLDEADDIALKIGAVNTIINNDGCLKGYNSDGLGAVKALSEKTGDQRKEHCSHRGRRSRPRCRILHKERRRKNNCHKPEYG